MSNEYTFIYWTPEKPQEEPFQLQLELPKPSEDSPKPMAKSQDNFWIDFTVG